MILSQELTGSTLAVKVFATEAHAAWHWRALYSPFNTVSSHFTVIKSPGYRAFVLALIISSLYRLASREHSEAISLHPFTSFNWLQKSLLGVNAFCFISCEQMCESRPQLAYSTVPWESRKGYSQGILGAAIA